jgi:hypothetical protein
MSRDAATPGSTVLLAPYKIGKSLGDYWFCKTNNTPFGLSHVRDCGIIDFSKPIIRLWSVMRKRWGIIGFEKSIIPFRSVMRKRRGIIGFEK